METSSMSEKSPSTTDGQHVTAPSLVAESVMDEAIAKVTSHSATSSSNPNIVGFDGTNDPEDPQNWPNRHKYVIVGLLSSMQTMV